MHRSGTSAVARIINLLGVDLGPADDLMAATEANPRGYWESNSISRLNNRLLRVHGGSWQQPPALPDGWEQHRSLDPLRARAADLVAHSFAGAEIAGWKDPRVSLLLPFWRTVAPIDRTVLIVREPTEVAASLERRDGIDPEHAAELWLRYTAEAWRNDHGAFVVRYEDLFADLDDVLARLCTHLRLPEPGPSIRREIRAFVEPSLRRHRGALPSGVQARLAASIYDSLKRDGELPAEPLFDWLHHSWLERSNAEKATRLPRAQLHATEELLNRERQRATAAQRKLRELRRRRPVRIALGASQVLGRIRPWAKRAHMMPKAPGESSSLAGAAPAPAARRTRRAGVRATAVEQKELTRRLTRELPAAGRSGGPSVSIVIVNRSGEHHLRRCIPAIHDSDYADAQIVVVDNGSSDGSLDYLDTCERRLPMTVVRNAENRSFSEANNQGCAAASSELVALLNNDVEPITPGWLGRMVDTLLEHDAAAVGARLIYPARPERTNGSETDFDDLTLQHRGIVFARGDGVPRAVNAGKGEDPSSEVARAIAPVPAVTAACMLVSRQALDDVGGFTEGYVYGTEDVDLCLKLLRRGHKVVYDGGAALYHHEFGTQSAMAHEQKRLNRLANRQLFLDRWSSQIFREVTEDRLRGQRHWSSDVVHAGITVTRDDPSAGFGDWHTAHELGDALEGRGWRVSYLERHDGRWEHPPDELDVVVALLDQFPLHAMPRSVISVAWVRNWTDRWLAQPWFDDYDLVAVANRRSADMISDHSTHDPYVVPPATNPSRFTPRPSSARTADVVFAGNVWDQPRDANETLPVLADAVDVKLLGTTWEQEYSSAKVLVETTTTHAAPHDTANSRVLDALAAGTIVVTDDVLGARELFDEEFPTYTDADSLTNVTTALLSDDQRRRELVERYRSIVLARHTYAHRAAQLEMSVLEWVSGTRFSLCVGVSSRTRSESWGDYHFARALQRQLRRRGYPARVQLLDDWDTEQRARDDVVVHLFGLSQLETRPSQVNVLWVISHPDKVTPDLCESYDLVLTASDQFSERLRRVVSVPVATLPQATDPERFRPEQGGPPHDLLFVANSRNVRRHVIDDLLPTDHELAVYGQGWTPELLDLRHLRGKRVPNRELNRYYAAASIVLNDHWPDMSAAGFISNRVYDALASGAFVISDAVDGIDEEFDGGVVTYRDAEDLRTKVDHYLANPDERRAIAERGRQAVLERHTFSQRVDRLLAELRPILADRPSRVIGHRFPARTSDPVGVES